MIAGKNKTTGIVYLVGAGPGRSDLITVRGAELIGIADCIICDKLANPAILAGARRDAEIIHVPKRIGPGSVSQAEIDELLIRKVSEGKVVVRLKGGDPCIFGRGAEEARLLAQAGIRFEIVPGVTAAVAAAEYTGIMLTERTYSSQVVFVTGHEAAGKQDSGIDWDLLARFRGTIVFYMAVGALEQVAEQLRKNGMPADTPAGIVADATLPTQRVIRSPISQIAQACKVANIEPPALLIVGQAAAAGQDLDWFTKKPLFGKRVVATRDQAGNEEFSRMIVERAAIPIEFPTITLKALIHTNEFLLALTELTLYDWIIFTSANGVAIFFEALEELGKDARVFGPAKAAALGDKTAERLAHFGLKADFVPTVFTGKELGRQLVGYTSVHGKRLLLLRSELASGELTETLSAAGAEVKGVAIYTAIPRKDESDWLEDEIVAGRIHWLTFASPSAVRAFFEQIPVGVVNDSIAGVASIGPVTSDELARLGVRIDATAKTHTLDGLLNAIEEYEEARDGGHDTAR